MPDVKPTASTDPEKESETVEYVEYVDEKDDGVDRRLAVKFPASLQGLSETEIAAIDKRATRKLDILMVPTLMALYVLNYLGWSCISSLAYTRSAECVIS